MSSTKRKQNKPQKIFNSKFNNNNKSNDATTTSLNNTNNNSSEKIIIKEGEQVIKTTTTKKEDQVWRVINDIPSPSTFTTMKEFKQTETNLINSESSLTPTYSYLNNSINETLLNLMQQQQLQQQNSSTSGVLNNMNLIQSIEKLVLMNLTPYLLGMMNNNQLQTLPLVDNSYSIYENYLTAFSAFNNNQVTSNQYDLLKESIESLLPKTNTNKTPLQYLDSLKSNEDVIKKKKSTSDDLNCSCGSFFDSLDMLNQHLKLTNHKRKQIIRDDLEKSSNKLKKSTDTVLKNQENLKSSTPTSTVSSVSCLSPSQSPINSNKMVRGQEEWVKNSRDNNFIAQILKCLECSASFETLSDLSLHMLETNHFSKIHHQSLNAPLLSTGSVTNSSSSLSSSSSSLFVQSNTHKQNEHVKNSSSNNSSQSKHLVKNKKTEPPVSAIYTANNVSCRLKNSMINQSELKCLICNKQFDHMSSGDQQHGSKSHQHHHKQQEHQLPPLVKLIQHLQNVHKITNVCTNCGAFFNNIDELQRHLVEESYNHNYTNQLSNLSNKNKLKSTSSNSNLNVKKFKSDNSFSRSNNNQIDHTDYNDTLKLNLLVNNNNKQRNEITNDKFTNNNNNSNTKLNMNSISPSSSTSSYSYASSNSSPSSFSFDHQQTQTKMDSHPLLALQMFVNGSNILSESSSLSSSSSSQSSSLSSLSSLSKYSTQSNQDQINNKSEMSKLPAKKRPYIDDSMIKNEFENSRSSFKQLATNINNNHIEKNLDDMPGSFLISKLNCKSEENCFKRSKSTCDNLDTLTTKENKKCHNPLNLLQKMQIGLDDYLMR